MSKRVWHIITGEYPPRIGGVSQYTFLVSSGLAKAGDEVHVWCPNEKESPTEASGVVVHPELGRMSPYDLWRTGKSIGEYPFPRRMLVQWVPHGFGYKTMNLVFCFWLWWRAVRHGDEIELMVHEPYLPFAGSWKQHIAAVVHRLMTAVILRASNLVWMSIPAWEKSLRPYALGRKIPFKWLPVISNVPEDFELDVVDDLRSQYVSSGEILIGHYGTFGRPILNLLEPVLISILSRNNNLNILLIGPNGESLKARLSKINQEFESRTYATGKLDTVEECAKYLKICDLLFQPYPDGASTRRGSLMAGLNLGLPVVTTMGKLSETLWSEWKAVCLVPAGDLDEAIIAIEELVADPDRRKRLGCAGKSLYDDKFKLARIVSELRSPNLITYD